MGVMQAKGHFPGSFPHLPGKLGQSRVPSLSWGSSTRHFGHPEEVRPDEVTRRRVRMEPGRLVPIRCALSSSLTLDAFPSSKNQVEHEAGRCGRCLWSGKGVKVCAGVRGSSQGVWNRFTLPEAPKASPHGKAPKYEEKGKTSQNSLVLFSALRAQTGWEFWLCLS